MKSRVLERGGMSVVGVASEDGGRGEITGGWWESVGLGRLGRAENSVGKRRGFGERGRGGRGLVGESRATHPSSFRLHLPSGIGIHEDDYQRLFYLHLQLDVEGV